MGVALIIIVVLAIGVALAFLAWMALMWAYQTLAEVGYLWVLYDILAVLGGTAGGVLVFLSGIILSWHGANSPGGKARR